MRYFAVSSNFTPRSRTLFYAVAGGIGLVAFSSFRPVSKGGEKTV